jgi:hypothetical protein
MVTGVNARGDGGFDDPGVAANLACDGPWLHGLHGSPLRTIPIATAAAGLLIARFSAARPRQVQPCLFDGRDAQRTLWAIPSGTSVASDACGAVPLRLPPRHEVVEGLVHGLLVGVRPPGVHP